MIGPGSDDHQPALTVSDEDRRWMSRALELADRGAALGEVPVGALLVLDGKVIAEGWNRPISSRDPTAHAEIVVLRLAAEALGNYRLPGSTLYVTLEPCTMCVGALVHARVQRLVFGASEPKAGAVHSRAHLLESDHYNHRVLWQGGVLADHCSAQLSEFFLQRRQRKAADPHLP